MIREEKSARETSVRQGTKDGDALATTRRKKSGDGEWDRKMFANTAITPEERWNMIAVAAYYRAEQRGFIGGNPAEDWIAAEEEIDTLLNGVNE
uniref:DUF2934 domain-containing protein n=1 Tax=Candidatus Kentrum sp. SD TaxID=2126332 RepID=A0A450Z1H0_9GAMM|nr:MAG: Protein of unknown function (DUF2934) [Candidatus Kentron sp. SD]VFK47641.1 MAG: Protein of unknown function (DUF2934) [Candidatus Kentron sp. SD]VFK80299.1 MAG: Protein of unknown function (DUF2934) [Candidatus Kentron sp. SD]